MSLKALTSQETAGIEFRENQRSAMATAVERVLSSLDHAGVPSCVLRNRDRIPAGLLEWDDLDLMVPNTVSRQELVRILSPLMPLQILAIRAGFTAFFFPVGDLVLRVDVYHGDLEWRAAAYGLNSEILSQRWNDDGIEVASSMHQAFLAWFSRLLRERSFKERYAPMISDAVRERPAAFRALLSRTFGEPMADDLMSLATTDRLKECDAIANNLRRLVWLHALRRRPLSTLGRAARQVGNAIEHRIRPTGIDVALLGPDGSGKTSLCETISDLPSRRIPFAETSYRKLYHRVLPTLGDLESMVLRKPRRAGTDATNPQGAAPRPLVAWMIAQTYYTIDHWLSELIWNRRKLAHGNLILLDRHPLEVVIDPIRYRYRGPMRIARWFARLAPQPDLLIVLDAPPDVIQARKQELTLEETSRQRWAFRSLAASTPNARIVDASQPFDKVLDDVLAEISSFAAERTARTFHLGERFSPAPRARADKERRAGGVTV